MLNLPKEAIKALKEQLGAKKLNEIVKSVQDRITKELMSNSILLRPEKESSRRTFTFPGIFRPRFTPDPDSVPIVAYEGITGRPLILESNDGELTEQQHNMILYGGTRGGGKTDLVRQEIERQDIRPSSQGTVAPENAIIPAEPMTFTRATQIANELCERLEASRPSDHYADDDPRGVSRIRELMYRAMGAQPPEITPEIRDNGNGTFTHTFTTNLRSITYGPFQPPVDHVELRFDPSLTEDQREEQVQAITDSYRNLQPGDEVIHVDHVRGELPPAPIPLGVDQNGTVVWRRADGSLPPVSVGVNQDGNITEISNVFLRADEQARLFVNEESVPLPDWYNIEYRHAVHAANRQHSLAHFLEGNLSPAGLNDSVRFWDMHRYRLLLTFVQPERVQAIDQSFRGCIHISRSSTDSICIDRVGAERVIDSLRMYFESMGFLPSPTPITRWTYEHWSGTQNQWRPEERQQLRIGSWAAGGVVGGPAPDWYTEDYRNSIRVANRRQDISRFLRSDRPSNANYVNWDAEKLRLLFNLMDSATRQLYELRIGHFASPLFHGYELTIGIANSFETEICNYFIRRGMLPTYSPNQRFTDQDWIPSVPLDDLIENTSNVSSDNYRAVRIGVDPGRGSDYAAYVEYGRESLMDRVHARRIRDDGISAFDVRTGRPLADKWQVRAETKPPLTERPKRKINFSKDESEKQ